jgi:hypothetical protein
VDSLLAWHFKAVMDFFYMAFWNGGKRIPLAGAAEILNP